MPRKHVYFFLFLLLLVSCGKQYESTNESVEISGVVQAGRVKKSKVKAYKIKDGKRDEELGSTTTNSEGEYKLAIPPQTAPVEVVSTGGTYTDEATGKEVKVKESEELSVVLENAASPKAAPVTPITTQVRERVMAQLEAKNVSMAQFSAAKDAALQEVAQMYGTTKDTIMAIPGKPENPGSQTSHVGKGALLLATLSQYLKDKNLSPNDGVNPFDALKEIAKDFKNDGKLDGKDSGTPISSTFQTVCTGWTNGMGAAVDNLKNNSMAPGFRDFDKNQMGLGQFKAEPENKIAAVVQESQTQVAICHIPPGYPENTTTITVGETAVDSHLQHGDYRGECRFNAPTITSVLPLSGGISGATKVTITGTGFRSDATVQFGNASCSSIAISSTTSLTCRTPSNSTGWVSVIVTNRDSQSGSKSNAFYYIADVTFNATGYVAGTTMGYRAIATDTLGRTFIAGTVYSNNDMGITLLDNSGTLVTSFGSSGIAKFSYETTDAFSGIALQTDGKPVSVGTYRTGVNDFSSGNFSLGRFNSDGTSDSATWMTSAGLSLGSNLYNGISEMVGRDIAIQSTGKFVALAGGTLFRLKNTNGDMDTTFGSSNTGQGNCGGGGHIGMALQSDDKILLVSSNTPGGGATVTAVVRRCTADGLFDTTFDSDGTQEITFFNKNNYAEAVVVELNGRIIVAGYGQNEGEPHTRFIFRLNSDGSLDSTFGSGGKVFVSTSDLPYVTQYGKYVTVDSESKVLLGGGLMNTITVLRFTSTGSLDSTFDSDGIVNHVQQNVFGTLRSLHVRPDHKIVIVGDSYVARLKTNGTLDKD